MFTTNADRKLTHNNLPYIYLYHMYSVLYYFNHCIILRLLHLQRQVTRRH